VFLVVGCFLDAIPAIIVVGTTLEPLARSALCLMISCAIARVRLRYALKDTMIMLLPMLLVLAATITWPEIPLFLPRLISPEFLR
jgi:TRAP-type C4-dicarboxylate transport system permease large subunit